MKNIWILVFLVFVVFLVPRVLAIDISDCSVLDQPGATYYLTQNITDSSTSYCMNISANNVTLDCQGNIIDGDDSAILGIYVSRSTEQTTNITIKNCVVTDWDYENIYFESSSGNNLININSYSSDVDGIRFFSPSSNNNLTNITVHSCGNNGISIISGNSFVLKNIDLYSNNNGIFIEAAGYSIDGNKIINASLHSNTNGIYVWNGYDDARIELINSSFSGNSGYDVKGDDETNRFTYFDVENLNFSNSYKIYYPTSAIIFNYNKNTSQGIWLNSSVASNDEVQKTIIRELTNWTHVLMRWNDTSDTSVHMNYSISGLKENTHYNIYNDSEIIYTLYTDSTGVLPTFTIYLGSEHEIKVQENIQPVLINITTDKSTYYEGDTVYFISYVNDTSGDYVKLLIDNNTDFTDCNYSTTSGCIAFSSPLQTTGSPQQLNATLTASQNTTWYAKVCDDGGLCFGHFSLCYQEFANKSTNCGGLGNGSYVFDGDWDNENNLIDGNWSSYARLGGCNVVGDLYMNYTIPSTVINAMVEDKYQYVITGGPICPSFREFISISYQNSSKEIKSICDGENILGLSHNKIRDNRVIKKTEHYYNGLLYKFYGNNFELEATANHMIYVKNNGYIRADKVKIGDDFLILKENKSLSYEKVKKIESYWYNGRVYDLATETQNFFANNILVHNVYDDSRLRCYNGSEWETVKDLSDSGVLVNENATISNSCLQGDVLQLKYHFDTGYSPACYASFYEEAMWWNMSFSGSFTVSSPEVIDITIHDVPIQFGNADPGTVNKSAQSGNGYPMIVTIEPTTTVNTNLTLKGLSNFSSGSYYFNIGNLTYSNSSTTGNGIPMTSSYPEPPFDNWLNIPEPSGTEINRSIYFWISVPTNQKPGTYTTTVYIKVYKN